jgi:hypothetical protein
MRKIIWLAAALVALWPQPSRAAGQAEVTMLPTRVVMDNADRFATVIGQATGNFTTDLTDMQMTENGMVVPLEDGKTDPYSAIPYVHLAPKSFTLKPGESQNVRILLRKPEGLAPGEYRSHLKVRLADDNVENTQAPPAGKQAAGIAVKTNLVLVIPVIFRHGDTTLTMKIEEPKLTQDPQGKPELDMYLAREGSRSSMGDITVNYVPDGGGKPVLLKSFPGVPVYRPTPRRFIAVPLDVPAGVSLTRGSLDIVYTAQEKEGGKQLAEANLPLGR